MTISKAARQRLCLRIARLSYRHPYWAAAAIPAFVLLVRLCCLPVLPAPVAKVPDEQSYLLLARTFAAGRIANPPHPMWQHFEALFVLQQPSYASVYPPVQGMFLALGWIFLGQPWAGVLASVASLMLAIGWMLRAYVPRPWALYGGVVAGAGYGTLSYWTNSYWGGAGAAIGGALTFGALPRVLCYNRRRDSVFLALGILLLANSRPYEGLLTAIPVGLRLLWFFAKPGERQRIALRSHAPVLGGILLAGAVLTCFYNFRVTGHPFRLPHMAYIEQYAVAPAFVWQHPRRIPEYRDRLLRDAHLSFEVDYAEYLTLRGTAGKCFRKLERFVGL
jgi:hypothetical protein